MSDRVSIEKDCELFIAQAAWAASALPEYSLAEYVRWICVQLAEDDPDELNHLSTVLLQLLRIDSTAQKQAEESIVELLGMTFHSASPRWVVSDFPGRNVDWSETYRRSLTGQPTRFVSRKTERRPDGELMGALCYQARQWRDLLSSSDGDGHAKRAKTLGDAIEATKPVGATISRPLTRTLLNRLYHHGPRAHRAAQAIERVFALQHSPPSFKRLEQAIRQAIDESDTWMNQQKNQRRKNPVLNSLLEFSVLSSITQTASRSHDWEFVRMTTEDHFEAQFVHRDRPIELIINKKAPCDDVFTKIRAQAGMTKNVGARHSQPDICLTFRHREDTSRSISVLGDAKRNGDSKKGGASYFRDSLRTATYYLAAFANGTGCQFDESGVPVGKIRPTFTLFFRQGTDANAVQESLVGEPDQLPPILACDIENHFGLDSEEHQKTADSTWHSEFLTAWLRRLTEQALVALA